MEKCICDIRLTNGPLSGSGNFQHRANGSELADCVEGLIEVNTRLLIEPARDPMRFIPVNGAIRSKLMPKKTLIRNNISRKESNEKNDTCY